MIYTTLSLGLRWTWVELYLSCTTVVDETEKEVDKSAQKRNIFTKGGSSPDEKV